MRRTHAIGSILAIVLLLGAFSPLQAQAIPYQINVLSLRYFPLVSGTSYLDRTIVGDNIPENTLWTDMNAEVTNVQGNLVQYLEEGSAYHGYRDSTSPKSLDYSIYEDITSFEALPAGLVASYDQPDTYFPDYKTILQNLNICNYVDNLGIKEVWLWGYHTDSDMTIVSPPYIVPVESNMAMGTNSQAFWNYGTYGDVSNSGRTDDLPTCDKTYTLYNYNYGRGLGEAMEDHGHQLEAVFNFIDWYLFWFKFVSPYGSATETNQCGWTHYAPNSTSDYDWQNTTAKSSNCEDWHPDGTGQTKQISCYTWPPYTCPDDSGAAFKKWWMQNIPGDNNGLVFEGAALRNWWDFIGDFDAAVAQGQRLTVADTTAPTTSILSVAGDTVAPYWDTSNNSGTSVVFSGEANMLCRWGTTDVVYSAMSSSTSNRCSVSVSDSIAFCSFGSLAQSASYTRYVSCMDAAGNAQSTSQNLNVSFGVDWTAPNNVTILLSTSHTTSTWSNDNTVGVSWTAATDNTGGSGLDGYSVLWDTTSNTLPDTTKDIEETVTTQTSSALANGSSHYFHIRSVDNAGIWATGAAHLGPFYIDITGPATSFTDSTTSPIGTTPSASSWQDANFTVSVSDADTGGSGLSTCYYGVKSDDGDPNTDDWTVTLGTTRTPCGSVPQITVGPTGNCRNTGRDTCIVYIYSTDGTGLTSNIAVRRFSIGFLTYPSDAWQRLWYTDPENNNFSAASYLNEVKGYIVGPEFDTNWENGSIYYGVPSGEVWNDIGFKSSRTINFATAGLYRFTLTSDDGVRLFIDEDPNPVALSGDHASWQDKGSGSGVYTADVDMSAGDHKFQIDYYEDEGYARIAFTYALAPCQKSTTPIQYPQEPEKTLTLPNNGGSCAIRIKHVGADLSDSSEVKYEELSRSGSSAVRIGMDDNPASGCENNLKWTTAWQDSSTISQNYVVGASSATYCPGIGDVYCATHQLAYGFEVSSPNCVITSYTTQCTSTSCGWSSSVGWNSSIKTERIDARTVKVQASRGTSSSVSTDGLSATLTLAKDNPPAIDTTQIQENTWQKGNPSLSIGLTDDVALSELKYAVKGKDCNFTSVPADPCTETDWKSVLSVSTGSPLSLSGTSLGQNVKISSTDWGALGQGTNTIYLRAKDDAGQYTGDGGLKSFTIKKDTLIPISESIIAKPPASGYRASDDTYWFKVGDYSITIIDKDDTTPGVGKYSDLDIDSCYYRIKDLGTGTQTLLTLRACNLEIPLKVDVGLNCVTEGENKCQLELWSSDKAGNQSITTERLNIDRTAPSAK